MTIMITRNNLGSFFSKSYCNFEVSLLRKTVVVIHGDDFIHYILKNVIGFEDNNHNEFLLFSMTASNLINQVKMCDIQPLFIFDGCTKVGQNQSQYSNQMWSVINRYKSSFVDVLSFFQIKYMTSLYSAQFDAASLSIYLHCPFLASSYDIYYMFPAQATKTEANIMQELIYVPIHLLDFFSCKNDAIILSHVFHQKFSRFSSVAPHLRPLLSVLYAGRSEVRANVYKQLKYSKTDYSKDTGPCLHEWFVLVNWLVNSSNVNYVTLYEYVIQAHRTEERQSVTEYLLDCIAAFMDDVRETGLEIASYFCLVNSSSNVPKDKLIEISKKTNASVSLQHMDRLINQLSTKQPIKSNFAHDWPLNLIELYRKVKLSPAIIDILHHSIRKPFLSVHAYSVNLRLLVYRILYGLENCSGVKLNPDITEYTWINDNMLTEIPLTISPLLMNPNKNNSVDEIVSSQLNIPLPQHTPNPDWIFSLAITLAFWHQQRINNADDGYERHFENSPIGLAIATCAVVNVFNIDFMSSNLQEHYTRWIDFIRNETSLASERASSLNQFPLFCTKSVTEQNLSNLIAVQNIYNELQTVVSLLNCLAGDENKSKLFNFLPFWILFPSFHLIDCLSHHLDNQLPSIRLIHITSYWIPRLCCAKRPNSLITDFIDIFKRLVNIVTLLSESSLFNLKSSSITRKSKQRAPLTESTNTIPVTNVDCNDSTFHNIRLTSVLSDGKVGSVLGKHLDTQVIDRFLCDLTEK
ncbi:unnamed protein product [Schistosoma rodhaini]|nr:unnamed protein product [Schistosoma rodhaini]